jgi:hypothetical protein
MAIHRRPSLLIGPKTFNEKLSLRLAIDRRPLLVTLSDKIKMREYSAAKVGPQFLSKIYWVDKNASAMPFDDLPKAFVIKATHGSGFVRIVTNKSTINRDEVIKEAERVDMYDSNRGPIIGEMTCVPQGATGRFSPSYYDTWPGSFWKFNAKA